MPSILGAIPFDLIYLGTAALLVVAFTVGGLRWWSLRSDEDAHPPERQPEESHGYPLASWRYVYDLDKPDAKRAVDSVNDQAETLAEAEKKRR
ncbi:hypothetical protein [Haloferax larsenii]|uniref:Uncharacterized protein n=1 Tax=Haloferax larsenii TaxID=302484 RepID=A0A1H7QKJ7_HALLR|nr:hypothetical protein [Haloferax larsenii]SEL48134.1 hypothetical protein SAMN04488691_10550 [Haloferax larsenii]